MPTTEFNVKVITPDGEVWNGTATSVVIPGLDGYFGVWAHHSPLIAAMDIGSVLIKTPEEHVLTMLAVAGGFVEIDNDGVKILAESAELSSDIDTIRATHAADRARERLSKSFADIDISRAEVAMKKALNRKRVAERAKAKPTEMV